MFERDALGVYIDDNKIELIVGKRREIKAFEVLKTPEGSVIDDKIINIEPIKDVIKEYMNKNNIKIKDLKISISGQDIVIRHIEIPIMEEKNIRKSVEWEISQYLPDNGENHYIDFEILEKVEDDDKKIYKILTVAALKEKIDNYLNLSKSLNLKLKAIDVSANCIARIFKTDKKNISEESIGIINIGDKSSNIVIVENGRLFMEREVPFGTDNVVRDISKRLSLSEEASLTYLKENFDFKNLNENREVDRRIQTLFDNMFSAFLKVIQFYATGKVKKNLDAIYITGSQNDIKGMSYYISNYFSTPVKDINSLKGTRIKMRLKESFDLKKYTNVFGLMLRKE